MSSIEVRRKVLVGGFSEQLVGKWETPSWTLLVFVSSTFTDTTVERDLLMGKILKELRKVGIMHSISISFSDMRWGVRDENTLEHETWAVCKRELLRCMDQSNGIFFLSLQSEKYVMFTDAIPIM